MNAFDQRYARQHVLHGFGIAGQEKLANSRVLIVGAGGLGSPASMYLAAAGVGALTLVDTDVVHVSNLHRQLLYGMSDLGSAKIDAAVRRLTDINPLVEITALNIRLSNSNVDSILPGHDIVVDATDNFAARYTINDACFERGIPWVYGSVARFEGQVTVFGAPGGPCYRCLFPEPPAEGTVPSCAEEGVLGVVPGIVGLYQAMECIKMLCQVGTALVARLMLLDLLENDLRIIGIPLRADCSTCGKSPEVAGSQSRGGKSQLGESQAIKSTTAGAADRTMPFSVDIPQLSSRELAARLASGRAPVILDVREPWEYEIAHLPGSRLVPLVDLQRAVRSLNKNDDYVVICHRGMRSELAAGWLQTNGFKHVSNLEGGIDSWSLTVDPRIARY